MERTEGTDEFAEPIARFCFRAILFCRLDKKSETFLYMRIQDVSMGCTAPSSSCELSANATLTDTHSSIQKETKRETKHGGVQRSKERYIYQVFQIVNPLSLFISPPDHL